MQVRAVRAWGGSDSYSLSGSVISTSALLSDGGFWIGLVSLISGHCSVNLEGAETAKRGGARYVQKVPEQETEKGKGSR